LHGGASGSGPPGERNGQYRHGEQTEAAIAERQKFSALLKTLRAGLSRTRKVEKYAVCATCERQLSPSDWVLGGDDAK